MVGRQDGQRGAQMSWGAWGNVMEQHETKPGALGALGALKRRSGVFGDLLILALVVGGWFLLQAVILPRLGINT